MNDQHLILNQKAKLIENVFDSKALDQQPTRDGFGKGVVEAGEADERVVVLCADLAESTRAHWFKEKFPERYIELGVAEQNLATVGSGLANYGKIPFITSYAAFSPGRNNEQIRTTISLNNVPVKIAGAHAGVSVGPDGATHQQLEDIALMRVQPNMTVVVPADAEEARKATVAAAKTAGPVYLRFAREKTPVFTSPETPFRIGKALVLAEPDDGPLDVVVIGCGPILYYALLAGEQLAQIGVRIAVLNNHTVKPLDKETISTYARRAGAIVTVEEHQIAGGLGSAVTELIVQEHPVPIEFVGVRDQFGQSGTPEELFAHYGLNVPAIVKAIKRVIARK